MSFVYGFNLQPPAAPPLVVQSTQPGQIPRAVYTYVITYITAHGETTPSPVSPPMLLSNSALISGFTSPNNIKASIGIYRSRSHDENFQPIANPEYFLVEILPHNESIFIDTKLRSQLGKTPPTESFGSSIGLEAGYIRKTKPVISSIERIVATGTTRDDAAAASPVGLIIVSGGSGAGILMPPQNNLLSGITVTVQTASTVTLYPQNPLHTIDGSPEYVLENTIVFTFINNNWTIINSVIGTDLVSVNASIGDIFVNNIFLFSGTTHTLSSDIIVNGNFGEGLTVENNGVLVSNNVTLLNFISDNIVVTDSPTTTIDILNVPDSSIFDTNAVIPQYPTSTSGGIWYGANTKLAATNSNRTMIGNNPSTLQNGITYVGSNCVNSNNVNNNSNTSLGRSNNVYDNTVSIGVSVAGIGIGGNGNSTGIGFDAYAPIYTVSIGPYTTHGGGPSQSDQQRGLALGRSAVTFHQSTSIGTGARSSYGGTSLGVGAITRGDSNTGFTGNGTAIGRSANATRDSVSLGISAVTALAAFSSTLIGRLSSSVSYAGVAIGLSARASGSTGVAIGPSVIAVSGAVGIGITATIANSCFIRHRGPLVVTTNAAGFVPGTNELVEDGSSIRFKDNIRPLDDGNVISVDNLRPVRYNPKGSQHTHIGLIAEEVNEIVPEVVAKTPDEVIVGLNYGKMVAVLISEIKKLKVTLAELKSR